MPNIYNSGLASGVGSAMSRQTMREAYVELPNDKDGNCTTRHSPTERKFFKGVFIGEIIFSIILIVSTFFFPDNLVYKMYIYIGVPILLAIIIFDIYLYRDMLFYRYTLTADALVIKKVFKTVTIPYIELREVCDLYPLSFYGNSLLFTSKTEVIKISFGGLYGGVFFTNYLAALIAHPLDNNQLQELSKRMIKTWISLKDRAEKRKRKKYVKSNK